MAGLTVKWKRLYEFAKVPKPQTAGAAGFDLHAADRAQIHPGDRLAIGTGVACALPEGMVGVIKPRSSWASMGATTDAGVIDCDYRGEIKVLLANFSDQVLEVKIGDRIAQMIVVPCLTDSEEVDELPETDRGAGGFGSTGS